VPYATSQLNNRYPQNNTAVRRTANTSVRATTPQSTVNRDAQRQAAMTQMERSTGKNLSQTARPATRDGQRQAANQQLNQISQRNNYRGYDNDRPQAAKRESNTQRTAARQEIARKTQPQQRSEQTRQRATQTHQRANALSGNDSRSANWQAQQQRGMQSRQQSARNLEQRSGGRAQMSERRGGGEHRELRHR